MKRVLIVTLLVCGGCFSASPEIKDLSEIQSQYIETYNFNVIQMGVTLKAILSASNESGRFDDSLASIDETIAQGVGVASIQAAIDEYLHAGTSWPDLTGNLDLLGISEYFKEGD